MKARRRLRLFAALACVVVAVAALACTGLAEARKGAPNLLAVRADELPQEARDTLTLIRQGGPFPYKRDGVVFGNRERRLPSRPNGYYREYTVPTPGVRDRGARRIVTGTEGEYYYTDDHYNTFRRIRE